MFLNKLLLLRRDIDRVGLDGIRIRVGWRAVDGGYELNRQSAIIADLFQRIDHLLPIPVSLTTGEAVGVRHVEIDQAALGRANRLVRIRLLDIEVEGIQADTAIRPHSFG